jgi:hypothetical protein
MATIEMNIDGCDIAHEALMLEEYGKEVCTGRNPQLTLVGESPVAQINKRANDRGRAKAPNDAFASAPEEVFESFSLLRSATFPQCP